MAFSASPRGRARAEINVTPLVDVVLVLLIIFMVLTPILLKQVAVKLPEKEAEAPATPPASSQLVVHIAADGAVAINREPVARPALADRVRALLADRRDKLLFFDIDDDANYGDAVQSMDACRGAGAQTIGLIPR